MAACLPRWRLPESATAAPSPSFATVCSPPSLPRPARCCPLPLHLARFPCVDGCLPPPIAFPATAAPSPSSATVCLTLASCNIFLSGSRSLPLDLPPLVSSALCLKVYSLSESLSESLFFYCVAPCCFFYFSAQLCALPPF